VPASLRLAASGARFKGLIEAQKNRPETIVITDTTENLARFIADAGDGLFSKEVVRLERVK
jgi:hypothetical protein